MAQWQHACYINDIMEIYIFIYKYILTPMDSDRHNKVNMAFNRYASIPK